MEIKKISSNTFGTVSITVTKNNILLFKLKDISKLFSINIQTAHLEIGNKNIHEITQNKNKNKFIDIDGLAICLRLSEDEKADQKYEWLKQVREKHLLNVYGYTIDDLDDPKIRLIIFNRIKQLELKLEVYSVKIEEDQPKVHLVESLYGTNAPIDISIANQRIKYKISQNELINDLRNAGIFDENNVPFQKYIDGNYFRLVTVISQTKTKEITIRQVLVYQKGIRLIEEMLAKKAGKQNAISR